MTVTAAVAVPPSCDNGQTRLQQTTMRKMTVTAVPPNCDDQHDNEKFAPISCVAMQSPLFGWHSLELWQQIITGGCVEAIPIPVVRLLLDR
mmetsp:Transcript_30193/g.49881  ORF Transcript_30193/g.49881 Transcript_30193/m.49881 type:complete len:91 (-) Transcript_30193:34-306(-)